MKLTRSKDDAIVSGVLAGIGEYFQIDPTLIRIGVAILLFFSPFPVLPLYIIGAVLIPEESQEDRVDKAPKRKRKRKAPRKNSYEKTNTFEEQPSSRGNTIEEDDWSDF